VGGEVPGDAGGVLAGVGAGSRVAGYLLEEQVGEGGMAVVFRARDERLGRVVAVKVLAPGLASDAEFRARFLRESRAAAAVDDPHIIPVFEAGEAGGVLFLAMRYAPGADVRTLVKREGPLPSGRAAGIISAVASALDAAHAAGLVHRDVKPANMLLDAWAGRPDHVYLSDFGLSKPITGPGLTRTGQFLGTLDYVAPEQLQGGEVDGRADQYALGCAAFELLAGVPPFHREGAVAVLYEHASEPPPLSSWRPELPRVADAVLARALAKAAGDRYGSCREFADALRAALGLPPYAQAGGEVGGQAGSQTVIRPGPEGGGDGQSDAGLVRDLPPGTVTITFLFTDIEGSTALLQRLGEDLYAQVLVSHHALIRSALAAHDGKEMDTQGDGFFAVFSSPRACVAAVLQMQQAMEARAWPGGERVRVRMGIHCGEAARTAAGLVGLEVHRAARVAAVAYGGQVLVSEAAAVLVRDRLPPGAVLTDLGTHRLKDLGSPEQIFQLHVAGLQAEFPPLRSLGNPALPNNLPAQLSTFIGRDREVAEVRALVKSARLVTLAGAGGCGKTRLGLQVAAELLDGSGDGVWLTELAAVTDENAVAAAISQALRLAARPARPVLEALLDALVPQDVLIVLDNCEHLIGGCAKTAEAILRRCPRVHLLATSREPLGIGGETIYRVPSMSLPEPGEAGLPAAGSFDAVALFADRARAHGIALAVDEQTGPLVVSICRRLDGMPLAIELAAARLRSMSLAELHDRLDQRFRLLTGGSRTAPGRQQTLRAAVGWSYSLLTGAEQVLLARLSVFAGSFGLDAAESVCGFAGLDALDVADLLGSLVDKSLVVAEPAVTALRYRLLETIRLFAAEQLVEARGEEATVVAAAHCAHFVAFAEAAAAHLTGSEQGSWLARLDADQVNLRRAAGYAVGRPDGTALVLRLGVALDRYWIARSRQQEAFGLLVPALRRPDADADPRLFAAALVTAAFVGFFIDIATARRLAEQAIRLARSLGDDRLLIKSLTALCAACFFAGEPETGLPFGQESVELARSLGDDVLLGRSLGICLLTMDPARFLQLVGEAIACTERSGDHLINSSLHNNASCHALSAGDIAAARAHLEAAAQAGQQIGYQDTIMTANLALVLRAEGDLDGARSTLEAALRVSRRNGYTRGMADAVLDLACLAGDAGDWDRAAALHGVAQMLLDRTSLPWDEFDARYRQDSLDQARAHLGDERLARAYAQGMALSLEKALDLALSREGSA
jgi:predicted ATPase/class 3 adenylate cyclase